MTAPSKEKKEQYVRAHKLEPLIIIGSVVIYSTKKGDYICFVSDLDVCTDGTGSSHGDPYYQPQTAYYNNGKYLNADKDHYIVIPPEVRMMPDPVVLGCQAKLTRLDSHKTHDAVCGEIGPNMKTGEAAICLARYMNPNVNANSGDSSLIYFYELWPGKPATVGSKS